jgi:hypothetical protein
MCVLCTFFPPAAEICARLAANYCQKLTTVKYGPNDLVGRLSAISQLASRVGRRGGVGHYLARERGREGGSIPYP